MTDFVVYGDGGRRSKEAHERKNKARVFVDGKYVGQSHTLGIAPGRYSSRQMQSELASKYINLDSVYQQIKEGYIYAIINTAWPEWVKVGMAVDPVRRLNGYQTSSPFRDFQLARCWRVKDRRAAEKQAHDALEAAGYERAGEWFKVPLSALDQLPT